MSGRRSGDGPIEASPAYRRISTRRFWRRAPDRGRAIDIGCGAGATTIALAAVRPELEIVGIDLSPALVTAARERASTLANAEFRTGAVEAVLPAVAPAELLLSRHGVMFFDDPVKGLAVLRAAAAPGAWLVFPASAIRRECVGE